MTWFETVNAVTELVFGERRVYLFRSMRTALFELPSERLTRSSSGCSASGFEILERFRFLSSIRHICSESKSAMGEVNQYRIDRGQM